MTNPGLPQTLLVVDDERDLTSLLKLNLERHGYHVFTANDADTGFKIAQELQPDLIILDINMPEKSGLELYQELCTEHGRPKYPTLILTAREDLKDMFKDIDSDGFISKPFEMKGLLKKIEAVLSKEGATQVFLVDMKTNIRCLEIAEFLERERYRVTPVETIDSFKEATRRIRPNFVVMEYMQQDASGDAVIQEIKKHLSEVKATNQNNRTIPLIVYSYSGMDFEKKSLQAGADKYIGKPESYVTIVTALREFELQNRP